VRDPDVRGNYGKAWKRRSPLLRKQIGLLESWIVDLRVPDLAHCGWFAVNIVSLNAKNDSGLRLARKAYTQAQYELQVVPIKAEQNPDLPWVCFRYQSELIRNQPKCWNPPRQEFGLIEHAPEVRVRF